MGQHHQDKVEQDLEQQPRWDLSRRAEKAWERYQVFCKAPGNRCASCWLLQQNCCCMCFAGVTLQHRLVVLMHHSELDQRRGSNTAKLLVLLGAELFVWGVEEHDRRLRNLLEEEKDAAVVLFPAPGAVKACELAASAETTPRAPPPRKCKVVLDGGWKETRKMNQTIDPGITRCCVADATRSEYGGTRKYKEGQADRVQTLAAFVAM